ncbi:AAA family ATPase [Bacillus sp. 165]|uniref:AAA family ATPase n=1 Tax=Bacillus sp. 165 TaxID=1529117 RepID=UPI001ADD501F|nr:AAA family ATPase [Bacillus sp. 165]MBO9129322.1 AAA family ATPase [Bacillus sp. 165]
MKVKQALTPKMIKKLQQLTFVGLLVSEQNLPQSYEAEKQQKRFYIKCLSPFPQKVIELLTDHSLIFSGDVNAKQNRKWLAPILDNGDNEQDFLFLFSLRYVNSYLYAEIIKHERKQAKELYHIIPAPQMVRGQTRSDFERKLVKGASSFLLPKYSSEWGSPEFLYYEGRVYGKLSLKSMMNAITFLEREKNVFYIEVEKQWEQWIDIVFDNSLYFINGANYEKIRSLFQEKAERLSDLFQPTSIREKKPIVGVQKKEADIEMRFLEKVKALANNKKIYIEECDIGNFHTCVKTNLITVIGGMSGTGKSQFVRLYGEALGLQWGKELLFIPVSPSYQEPEDILGYMNPSTGEYIESQTGLVRLLHEAEQHPDQLYMIVFDEMNLSQAEHWFSPFLSLLELEEEYRYLSLYQKKGQTEETLYKERIRVGKNVIFVGTVNFDETTRPLSDRLLDRINMITLQKMTFREAMTLHEKGNISLPALPHITTEDFRTKWVNQDNGLAALTEEEVELLDSLHTLLYSYDPSKGISYRIALSIAKFIDNIPQLEEGNPILSREEAFDLQIKQRVLTKLRGLESAVASLLANNKTKTKTLLQLLESPLAQEVSSFAYSIGCIHQKIRELELYGYAK